MAINEYYPNSNGVNIYTSTFQGTTRKVVTVKEYDEEGRLVKETITETTTTPQQYWYQTPTYPYVTYTDTTPPQIG